MAMCSICVCSTLIAVDDVHGTTFFSYTARNFYDELLKITMWER